jgi:hypothetical protein
MNQVMLPILQKIVKLNMFLIRTKSHLMTLEEIKQCQDNIDDNVVKIVKLKLS